MYNFPECATKYARGQEFYELFLEDMYSARGAKTLIN